MSVTATNPILPGFYPDPSALAVGDDYYIVNSSFAYFPGLPIMHSKDLSHWEQIGNALDRESQLPLGSDDVSRGLFAPTIRYHEGTYYIICTNVSFGGNFIVTATNPAGPWSEPHYIEGAEGIDPSLFFDEDGKCYYTGTHPNPAGCQYDGDWYIYTQELDIENFKLIGEPVDVWNGAMKGVHWPEGPHLYKIGEYYYILHAEGGTGPNHAISVARSKNVFGPFEQNFNNPIFTHRHLGKRYPIQYVGHADLFQIANGDWYMVMLATRPLKGKTTIGRETFLAKVEWEDEWPVVNPGLGVLSDEVIVDLDESIPDSDLSLSPAEDKHYEFAGMKELPLPMLALRNPKQDMYHFEEDGLSLKCTKDEKSYLCVRQDSHIFDAVAVLKTKAVAEGTKAGLILFQSDNYQLRVEYEGVNVNVIIKRGDVEEKIGSMLVAVYNVTLMISVEGLKASVFVGEGNNVAPVVKDVDISDLSTEVAGGFVGCTVGIFAEGTEGVADDAYVKFKSFSYRPL